MSVTIHDIPAAWSPSGNPLMYRFSSDQTAQPNFSYIVETYVNAVQVQEDRVFPEVGIYAHIDIAETVDALLSPPMVKTGLNNDNGASASIYIIVRENYGTPPTNQANATSSTTQTFKACVDDLVFETIDFNTDWKATKWLTNHPTNDIEILRNQTAIYSMITDASLQLEMNFYDSSNVLLHTYTVTNNYDIWQLNVSPTYLLLTTGISVFDLSQTAYFTMQIGTSDILTLRYLDDYCWLPNSLLWMNEYGGFDTHVFAHADNQSGMIESVKTYRKQFGNWSGNNFVYDSTNAGDIDYSKTKRIKGTLVSGYITESVYTWLVELYNSPLYVIYDLDGIGRQVTVKKSTYEYLQQRWEELMDVTVDYEESKSQKSVRR